MSSRFQQKKTHCTALNHLTEHRLADEIIILHQIVHITFNYKRFHNLNQSFIQNVAIITRFFFYLLQAILRFLLAFVLRFVNIILTTL